MTSVLFDFFPKVLALENYNTMSDSELIRVRSEVMRMDDKVRSFRMAFLYAALCYSITRYFDRRHF